MWLEWSDSLCLSQYKPAILLMLTGHFVMSSGHSCGSMEAGCSQTLQQQNSNQSPGKNTNDSSSYNQEWRTQSIIESTERKLLFPMSQGTTLTQFSGFPWGLCEL